MLPNHLIDSQTHIERFLFQQHNTSLTMLKRLKNKIMLLMDFLLKYILVIFLLEIFYDNENHDTFFVKRQLLEKNEKNKKIEKYFMLISQ